jgi:arylsulfatase A-like enzyme
MKSSSKKGLNSGAKKRITRRELLKYAAVAGPFLHAGLKATSQSLPVRNVIVFLTDQERAIQHFPDGWESQNLPGLTRLKQNGLSFESAFTNACMCSPARSTLMSGYFPAQHGVKYTLEDNMTDPMKNPQVELPVDLPNIATVMAAAGFNVVYKGKWHCSKASTAADLAAYSFQRWNPPDAGANQDPSQAGGGQTVLKDDLPNDQRIMFGAKYDQEGAIEFLTSDAAQQRPFFLVVSLVNPHDVLAYPLTYKMPQPKGFGYHKPILAGNIGIPATILENLSTKPTVQAQFLALSIAGLGSLDTLDDQLNYLNFYGNLMKASDNYLMQLLDTLTNQGMLENTLIIRTADHGEMGLTHKGQRQKNFNFYEESTRVPLVYSNPNLYKQPLTSNAIVSHVDFLPTIASLFNAPLAARAPWQGVDYSELVLNPSSSPVQDYTVFTYDDFQSGQLMGPYPGLIPPGAPNHIVSIREERYKLAEYYAPKRPNVQSQFEMYDRLNDPLETQNLAFEGFQRNNEQQMEYERLQAKLAVVQATRLQPLS